MLSTKDVKSELSRRVEVVTRPEFLASTIGRCLGEEAEAADRWETRVIQLDGTGAATVEIKRDGRGSVFAKLYPNNAGLLIYEKLKALRANGFGDGERYQAVEPLAFIPEYDMLLAKGAEGPAGSTHIGVDDHSLLDGVGEAATWLARLHSSPVRLGPPQPLLESGELLSLSRRLGKMISRRPAFLALVLEMIRALEALAEETVEGTLVQSHGQYRPIHVFISDSTVTVIDLDRSRPCDPARDVAEFLHRLRITMFWHNGSVERADAPTARFLEVYASTVADRAYLANLRFHWARYIFHSLNRKLKDSEDSDVSLDSTVSFYRSEFDNVIKRRFSP